jgi:hypothetical protein
MVLLSILILLLSLHFGSPRSFHFRSLLILHPPLLAFAVAVSEPGKGSSSIPKLRPLLKAMGKINADRELLTVQYQPLIWPTSIFLFAEYAIMLGPRMTTAYETYAMEIYRADIIWNKTRVAWSVRTVST